MWNKILFLSVVASIGVMSAMFCGPALPLIADYFQTDFSYIQYTITLFLVGNAVGQLLSGSLSDQIGQRRVMFGGLFLYLLASCGCALADRLEFLVAARFFQGVGSAVGPVLARAIAASNTLPERSAQIQSYGAMGIGVASIVATLSSGQLSLISWRWNFWLAAGLGLLLLGWTYFALREPAPAERSVSIKQFFMQMRAVFSHRQFLGNASCHAMTYGLMYGYMALFPFLFIEIFHDNSPAQVALYSVYMIAFYMLGSLLAARLVSRWKVNYLIESAIALQLIAGMILCLAPPAPLFFTALFLFNICVGVLFPLTSAGALASFATTAVGAASSALGVSYRCVGSLLSALICQFPLAGGRSLGIAMCALSLLSIYFFKKSQTAEVHIKI